MPPSRFSQAGFSVSDPKIDSGTQSATGKFRISNRSFYANKKEPPCSIYGASVRPSPGTLSVSPLCVLRATQSSSSSSGATRLQRP